MRESNLNADRQTRNREQVKIVQTSVSRKLRPEDEMIILMRNARNKFKKSLASGKIEIISKYEWNLR